MKDAAPDVLMIAIRSAARGETVLAPRAAARLISRAQGHWNAGLTPREVEVLTLVGMGLTDAPIH